MKKISIFLFILLYTTFVSYSVCEQHNTQEMESWAQSLAETLHITRQKYYFNVPLQDAMVKMLDAFVKFDDHSRFLGPEDYKSLLKTTNGEFYGIGVLLAPKKSDEDFLLILDTVSGGPAYKMGVKKHDKIIAINGKALDSLSAEKAVKLLKGEKRFSPVNITVLRNNKAIPFTIKRDKVKEEHVKAYYFKDHQIGYCALSLFTNQSALKLEDMLKKLLNKNIKGLILDLRDNAGGVLYSAIDSASLFLKKNSLVVKTKDKNKKTLEIFKTKREPLNINMPIFVLINNFTASCAEILAGALSHYSNSNLLANKNNKCHKCNYIFLLGTPSYGKGSVQEVIPLSNNCAIKLTTCLYYLPNSQSIQETGINPDFYIEPKMPLSEEVKLINQIYGKEKKENNKKTKQQDWKTEKLNEFKADYQIQSALHLLELLNSIAHTQFSYVKNHSTAKNFLEKHYITKDELELEEII